LRGQAVTEEQTPVWGGRVAVREGATTVINDDGTFLIRGVAPGTQWVSVQAIGRAPSGLAVDVRPGDSVWLPVTLAPLPVTLAPVRVVTQPARLLADFENRARNGTGLGYFRTEGEVANMPSMRSVLTSFPSIMLAKGQGVSDFVALLPSFGIAGNGVAPQGWCVPTLYIDGAVADWQQVHTMTPKQLAGVEMYPRASSAPLQYAQLGGACGVVLIWTKYLK
jgi:Carboxypeptidase regulatory-like domain